MNTIMKEKKSITIALIAIMLLSFFVVAPLREKVSSYSSSVATLDDKSEIVLNLAGAAALASSAITLIPGDTGTPIAQEVADFATYFLIILSAIYLEKYLLVITGIAAFRILIPIACLIGIYALHTNRPDLKKTTIKIIAFAFMLNTVVPGSMYISRKIESSYKDSLVETISLAEESAQILQNTKGSGNWLSKLTHAYEDVSEYLEDIMNNFIEATAIMLVTSCVIPILVLLFFYYIIKLFFGIELRRPKYYYQKLFDHEEKTE